ncbi:MAG: UDP-N-acetylglucosamine 2-epimerase (non-hydrolyzing), partial [Alphaproteobacteria bacterium]
MLSVHLIAAARPNFMKVAPLFHALAKSGWCKPVLVHTGQHYDFNMSDAFFQDLGLPEPDYHLGVGSGSHAEQTAGVMVAYEKVLMETTPDWVVVVGDVNSTIACTLAAKKLCLRVAHLEAGLRSRDWTMPEEINRMVTDSIADVLWTPSADGDENLLAEGVAPERISFVGNIMIDSYELLRERIEQEATRDEFGLEAGTYGVVTLHRPSNVDHPSALKVLVETLAAAASDVPLVFPL